MPRPEWKHLSAGLALLGVALVSGCSGENEARPEQVSRRLAISADWLNGSISLLDFDRLVSAGGTREDAIIEQIDLRAYGAAPLSVDFTPDGRLAVILLSGGVMPYLAGRLGIDASDLPTTGNAILVFDVEKREIVAGFPTADVPIMSAIDPRGKRAYASLLGRPSGDPPTQGPGSVAVYDLQALEEIERVDVAAFVEGLALNDSGTRGAVIAAGRGLYLFDPADLARSLSRTPLKLADDSSGVAFVSGTDHLVVANSTNPANHVVVDASDIENPKILTEGEVLDGVPFMVGAVPNRQEVVLPVSSFEALRLLHLDVSESPSRILNNIEVPDVRTFPQSIHVDPSGRYAFVGAAVSKQLLIFDLAEGQVSRLSWLDQMGPTALAVQP